MPVVGDNISKERILEVQEGLIEACKKYSTFRDEFLKQGINCVVRQGANYFLELDLSETNGLNGNNQEMKDLVMKYIAYRGLVKSNVRKNVYVAKGEENNEEGVFEEIDLSSVYLDKERNVVDRSGIVLITNDGKFGDKAEFCTAIKYLPAWGEPQSYTIDPCMAYCLDIIGSIMDDEDESRSCFDYKDSHAFFRCHLNIPTEVFDECVPNLINPVYAWSKPMKSKKLGNFFNKIFCCDSGVFGDYNPNGELLAHIFMNGDDMVWEVYAYEGVESKVVSPSHKPLYSASKSLMKVIDTLGKPIKEIYVVGCIHNETKGVDGNFIVRKCEDGEYIITVY